MLYVPPVESGSAVPFIASAKGKYNGNARWARGVPPRTKRTRLAHSLVRAYPPRFTMLLSALLHCGVLSQHSTARSRGLDEGRLGVRSLQAAIVCLVDRTEKCEALAASRALPMQKWHPASDGLMGTAVYGEPCNPTALCTPSIPAPRRAAPQPVHLDRMRTDMRLPSPCLLFARRCGGVCASRALYFTHAKATGRVGVQARGGEYLTVRCRHVLDGV